MFFNQVFFLLCLIFFCNADQFEEECGLEEIAAAPQTRFGRKVGENEFPWQVAIFENEEGQFRQACGGSLVRSELVITAAHCFSTENINHQVNVEDYRVVGGTFLSSWTARTTHKQIRRVRAVRLGERFDGLKRLLINDIAVVHLQTGFVFSPVVRAVCLDLVDRQLHNTQTSPGSFGKVAGWGLTESGTSSDILKFLRVPVLGDEQCTQQIISTYPAYISYLTPDKICAGLNNGSAVCSGDSGAGLVFPQATGASPPRWYLRGLLSSSPRSTKVGDDCPNNTIALYTNVFAYRDWLSNTLEEFQPQERCRARGSAGSCKKFSNCPAAMADACDGILPQPCSPSSTKICCVEGCAPLPSSAVSQRKTGSKAYDYCLDLPERLYPCQQNGSRGDLCGPDPQRHNPQYGVAPLTAASDSEMQRFGLVSDGGLAVFLVSERWLLTRATRWDSLLRERAVDITPPPEVVFSVSRTVRHPQYIPGAEVGTNDLVLVEMDRPVPFSRRYRPVCLHTAQDSVGGLTLSRGGVWGIRTQEPATLLSEEECRRKFPPGSRGAAGGVTDRHLCATIISSNELCGFYDGFLTASNGHRMAGGCTQLLVGLGLDGKEEGSTCKELFLRMSSYIPWVESVVWR